jgi:hypothetical protein
MQKGICWSENNKSLKILKITGVLLIPVILYLIPLQLVESHSSICLYKNITGRECYGCGMTRAIMSAIHFQFEKAFHYNKLFAIVLPLLVYIWSGMLIKIWFGVISPLPFLRKKVLQPGS